MLLILKIWMAYGAKAEPVVVPWGGNGNDKGQLITDGQGSPIDSFGIGGQGNGLITFVLCQKTSKYGWRRCRWRVC